MYSIGEFSKIVSIPVKTLRFYHEKGLLVPAFVDVGSGYRHYDQQQIETARIILKLREMEFSLEQIREMLHSGSDESDVLELLDQHRRTLEDRVARSQTIVRELKRFITQEKEARRTMEHSKFEIEEKVLAPQLIAGVRMRGKYSECGKGFGQIGRTMGRFVCGKCTLLHYDAEFREEADFEACMPVSKVVQKDGISVRELPGGRCVSLVHRGPYEELGRSYARLMEYVHEKHYEIELPTREIYLKGPGMIFKGNPRNYLTEIQMLIRESGT